MKRNGILALLTRVEGVVSVSIYTTDPVTCSPRVLTVSTVSPPGAGGALGARRGPAGRPGAGRGLGVLAGRGEFSHYNKRGEAGLSSTYLYSLLFMVHPVVFLIGRFAGKVHAEFL